MKRMTAYAALLMSACLIAGCAQPATTPPVVAPSTDTPNTPPLNAPPENAIYGNELPQELQNFTFFGEPATNYTVTAVTPRLFERFLSFDSTLSASAPATNEPTYELEHPEGPSECQGGAVYYLLPDIDFAVAVDEARCTGEGSGTIVPGILRDDVFTQLTGYEEHLDSSKNWDLSLVTANEQTVIWYMNPIDDSAGTVWVLFATDLQTRITSRLGYSSDPIFEQSVDPNYVYPPYTAEIVDNRLLFTLSTAPEDTDLRWVFGDTYGSDEEFGDAITEALFSVNLDGSDPRKELDPTIAFDPRIDTGPPMVITPREDAYALLQRTGVDEFTEVVTVGWETEYRPYAFELFRWSSSEKGAIALIIGKYIVVAHEADRTLTVIDSGIDEASDTGSYHREPRLLGDYLIWEYHQWDNYVTGIYALNRTNHKGIMTIINEVPGPTVLEDGALRIPIHDGADQDFNPLFRQGYLPLP